MEISRRDQPRKDTVALVRWSKKPGENPVVKFIMSSILGLILCLFLMIFLPVLRSFGAMVLFTFFFAALLTVRTVSAQRRFMRGLTKRINDTIAEVTSSPGDQLSVKQFRHMAKSGERLPLACQRRARVEPACCPGVNAGEKCPREMGCGLHRCPSGERDRQLRPTGGGGNQRRPGDHQRESVLAAGACRRRCSKSFSAAGGSSAMAGKRDVLPYPLGPIRPTVRT